MTNECDSVNTIEAPFEAPCLVVVGDAHQVVQGFFGTGWDGPYGLTEPEFEYLTEAGEI
jgi:hypothetical protein